MLCSCSSSSSGGVGRSAIPALTPKTLSDVVDDNDYALVLFHEGAEEPSAKVNKVLGHIGEGGGGHASWYRRVDRPRFVKSGFLKEILF